MAGSIQRQSTYLWFALGLGPLWVILENQESVSFSQEKLCMCAFIQMQAARLDEPIIEHLKLPSLCEAGDLEISQ